MIDNVRDTRCHPALCGHIAIRGAQGGSFYYTDVPIQCKAGHEGHVADVLGVKVFCLIILQWLDSAFVMRFMANSVGYLAFHISSSSPPSLS